MQCRKLISLKYFTAYDICQKLVPNKLYDFFNTVIVFVRID